MSNILKISLLLFAVLAVGCGQEAAQTAPEPVAEPEPVPVADAIGPEGLVVTADGSEFAPPIAPEMLPEGVWFCDMGTVHFARVNEGDGRCPLCGMFQSTYRIPSGLARRRGSQE